VAIKVISADHVNDDLCNECECFSAVQGSKHIVKFIDVFVGASGSAYLIMELCSAGDLRAPLNKGRLYNEDQTKMALRDICIGLRYCFEKGIVHRDLKPDNILRGDDGNVKITDFGLAYKIKHGEMISDFWGTPVYNAPEVERGDPKLYYPPTELYDPTKSDTWSLGVIMYELLTGDLPFESSKEIVKCDRPPALPSHLNVSLTCRDFLECMLQPNPRLRSSLDELLGHPWLTNQGTQCSRPKRKHDKKKKRRGGKRKRPTVSEPTTDSVDRKRKRTEQTLSMSTTNNSDIDLIVPNAKKVCHSPSYGGVGSQTSSPNKNSNFTEVYNTCVESNNKRSNTTR